MSVTKLSKIEEGGMPKGRKLKKQNKTKQNCIHTESQRRQKKTEEKIYAYKVWIQFYHI